MDLRVFIEPQEGATYEQQLAIALTAERLGFSGLFRSDHLMTLGPDDGLPGPSDAWVTLGGLARETQTIRLGTLVTAATFRWPGMLALAVAQVDAMSGGRVELGLGAGWHEGEHRARGIPFPPVKERGDRLEEQFAILSGIWATPEGRAFSHRGEYYDLRDLPALPRPAQTPGPPLIAGGTGPVRTPRLAARYAAEFNAPFMTAAGAGAQFARVAEACERAGRDPGSIIRSAAVTVCCGEDQGVLARRVAATGQSETELREAGAAVGRPEEVVERLAGLAAVGASRAYLQVLDLDDLEHLELIAAEVAPKLAAGSSHSDLVA